MSRLLSYVLLLVAAAAAAGCGGTEINSIVGMVIRPLPPQPAPSAKAKKARNLYYRILSKSNGQQIAEVRLPGQQIHAPFRLEARIGDFSKKQLRWAQAHERLFINDPSYRFSTHLIQLTFGEAGDTTDAKVTVSPEIDEVAQPDLVLDLPDTRLVDIALEHTGTELIYFAKDVGSAQYTEIGRTATTYTGPFVFTFDAFGLPKKAEAGIDDLLVVSRTAPPDLDTAQNRAVFAGTQGFDDLLLAVKSVDGLANDAATAKTALTDVVAHLDEATTELSAVDGVSKKAAKSLTVASKKASAALRKLNAGKAPSSTVKLLKGALQKLALAIALIDDA